MRYLLIVAVAVSLSSCREATSAAFDGGSAFDAQLDGGAARSDSSSQDANTPLDTSGSDAGTTIDAATDAASACVQCVDVSLEWGFTGGRRLVFETSTLASCSTFTFLRDDRRSPEDFTCTNEVNSCDVDAPAAVTVAQVLAALADSDVVAARAEAPATYGSDPRPVDGSIFSVTIDGDVIDIGTPCAGGGLCGEPLTAGLTALRELLIALEAQQRALPECAE